MTRDIVFQIETSARLSAHDCARLYQTLDELYALYEAVEVWSTELESSEDLASRATEAFFSESNVDPRQRLALLTQLVAISVARTHGTSFDLLRDRANALDPSRRLQVIAATTSPGKQITDLAGAGKAMSRLFDLIYRLLERWLNKDLYEQQVRKARLENDARVLKNFATAKKLGLTDPDEMRKLMSWERQRQDVLVELIADGKLFGARQLPSQSSPTSQLTHGPHDDIPRHPEAPPATAVHRYHFNLELMRADLQLAKGDKKLDELAHEIGVSPRTLRQVLSSDGGVISPASARRIASYTERDINDYVIRSGDNVVDALEAISETLDICQKNRDMLLLAASLDRLSNILRDGEEIDKALQVTRMAVYIYSLIALDANDGDTPLSLTASKRFLNMLDDEPQPLRGNVHGLAEAIADLAQSALAVKRSESGIDPGLQLIEPPHRHNRAAFDRAAALVHEQLEERPDVRRKESR